MTCVSLAILCGSGGWGNYVLTSGPFYFEQSARQIIQHILLLRGLTARQAGNGSRLKVRATSCPTCDTHVFRPPIISTAFAPPMSDATAQDGKRARTGSGL